MSVQGKQILLVALMLAACAPTAESEPAPEVVERFTTKLQNDDLADKAVVSRNAKARADDRMNDALQHSARSERERLGKGSLSTDVAAD